MPGGRGEGGARGRGLISLAPGRSGHHVCRHYDRHARCVAGSGLSRRRSDPRPLDGLPTKPGPDRTKGPHTPWEEPRWNAGRRARPIAEGAAQAAPSVARPARRMRAGGTARVCRRSASLLFAGSELQRVAPRQLRTVRSGLDGSPIPVVATGGGKQNALFDIARGRGARAGTGSYCIRPREAKDGGGASEMELRCRIRKIIAARAPPTAQERVPTPRYRGAGKSTPPPSAGRSGGRVWRGRKGALPRGRCGRSGRVRAPRRAASAAMRARHAARPG